MCCDIPGFVHTGPQSVHTTAVMSICSHGTDLVLDQQDKSTVFTGKLDAERKKNKLPQGSYILLSKVIVIYHLDLKPLL